MLNEFLAQAKARYVPAYAIATVYDGLGDFEQAPVWLNNAIQEREGIVVFFKFAADEINRASPHYLEELKQIGLDP